MHALHHMHIHNHIQPQLTTTFRQTDELDLENGNSHHGFLLHPFPLPPHCRSIICRQISDRISMLSPSPLSLTCFITNGQDELERVVFTKSMNIFNHIPSLLPGQVGKWTPILKTVGCAERLIDWLAACPPIFLCRPDEKK